MQGESERYAPITNRPISVRFGVREGGVSSCRVNPARQAKGCATPTAFRASRLRPENVAAHILTVEHDHLGELQWGAVMAVASFTVDPDPRCLRSEIAEAGDRAWSGFRALIHRASSNSGAPRRCGGCVSASAGVIDGSSRCRWSVLLPTS